jgi:pimeloyl-ACP methyl ester carboxylesterase
LLALLLLAPVGSFLLIRGGLALANWQLERQFPPPGLMIAVDSHRLHLFCQGANAPTVVLEPGLGVDWVAWAPVILDLARSVEVCVYDRAGYGWSEPGPMPRTAERSAAELHELLAKSNRRGPYVLVAHSFGGYIARVYASRYPDRLGGVVLVDPAEREPGDIARPPDKVMGSPWSLTGLTERLPPLGWERVKRLQRGEDALPPHVRKLPVAFRHRVVIASSLDQLAAERSELESAQSSQLQARAAAFPRDVPLAVITPLYARSRGTPSASPTSERSRDLHRKLAEESAIGVQVFAEQSGHMVHMDQPDVVVAAVRDVLSRVRQDRR